jgi:hypothetical protein
VYGEHAGPFCLTIAISFKLVLLRINSEFSSITSIIAVKLDAKVSLFSYNCNFLQYLAHLHKTDESFFIKNQLINFK